MDGRLFRGESATVGRQCPLARVTDKLIAQTSASSLVRSGADSTLRLWDVSQRACLSTTQAGTQVWAVDWQPIQADQTRVGKDYIWGGEDAKVNWMRSAGSGA